MPRYLFGLVALVACGDPPEDAPTETPATPVLEHMAIPLGSTFFPGDQAHRLPEGATWTLVEAAGSATMLEDPELRLTPDAAGLWRFTIADAEGEVLQDVDLTVVGERPTADTFRHYGYGPQRLLADDGERIWTLNPFRYTLDAHDRTTGEALLEIPTGAWPVSLAIDGDLAVLPLQAEDTLAIVDLNAGRVIDAIWVGDEPNNVLLRRDGERLLAMVTLGITGEVVEVDVDARRVTRRVQVGRDPRAMALRADGTRLYVASFRSGNATRNFDIERTEEENQDVFVIDTATWTVVHAVPRVGANLRGLLLSPDERTLYVTNTDASNLVFDISFSDDPHQHRIGKILVDEGSPEAWSVETRRIGVEGGFWTNAATPFAMTWGPEGDLWLSAGGSARVWRLDPDTLDPLEAWDVGANPRDLLRVDDTVWSGDFVDLSFTIIDPNGEATAHPLGPDPRPTIFADGQRLFYDAGVSFTGTFGCDSCHPDNNTDTIAWNLNNSESSTTRPIRLLSGTLPLLWAGINPNPLAFSFEVTDIMGGDLTGAEAEALAAYITSLSLPPPANAWTHRNGDYTDGALRGKALFETPALEGGAGCVTCHSGPKLTSQQIVEGKNGIPTDVPTLLGAYRNGVFFRRSNFDHLEEAVAFSAEFAHAELDEAQLADVLDYVRQLTPKAIFVLTSEPVDGARGVPSSVKPSITFSDPIDPSTVGSVVLWDETAQRVIPAQTTVSGAMITFEPEDALIPDHIVRIRVAPELADSRGQPTGEAAEVGFTVGHPAAAELVGTYRLDVFADLTPTGLYNGTLQTDIDLQLVTVDGYVLGTLLIDSENDFHVEGTISGDTFQLDPFVVEVSIGGFDVTGSASDMVGVLVDADGDGIAEGGSGTAFVSVATLGIELPGEYTLHLVE